MTTTMSTSDRGKRGARHPDKPPEATTNTGVFLSPEQVCELIPGMTRKILQQMRTNRVGPSYLKPSYKTVVYDQKDVTAWLESTRQQTR